MLLIGAIARAIERNCITLLLIAATAYMVSSGSRSLCIRPIAIDAQLAPGGFMD